MHSSFVYFVKEIFSRDNCGPKPPPIMLLSDGGHVENLALLPLLKKRLKKIIVVDGGYKDDEQLYGESLLNALMLARKKLNCSFLSEDGRDVISDLLGTFVKPIAKDGETLPRYYRFVRDVAFKPLSPGLTGISLRKEKQTKRNKKTNRKTSVLARFLRYYKIARLPKNSSHIAINDQFLTRFGPCADIPAAHVELF